MRALIFDPFAGISGDMILGALIDLGLEPAWLEGFVGSLGFEGVGVVVERANRRGIDCGRVRFDLPHEHAHRHLRHIVEIVDRTAVPETVKARAIAAFTRLAEAEAGVHGTTVEKVHFHEVGALDAILDVLCAMAAIEHLGFEAFFTRPVALGSGWIEIEHGKFPVPAPATLKLLEGIPVADSGLKGECTTPTGAAILATLTGGQRPPEEVVVRRSGFGAGTRDPESHPNCLRLVACDVVAGTEGVIQVLADLDDLSPEYLPSAQAAMMAAGALDTAVLSIGMKKGRPGFRLEALVRETGLDAVLEALFRTTSTIGVRHWNVQRTVLERREENVQWRGQDVRLKRVELPGGESRTKPEFDDVERAADAVGLSPYEVRLAIDGGTKPADTPEK